MLSSWLCRIAAEYQVGLEHLAQHLGLSACRAVDIDHVSTPEDIERAAAALSVAPAAIRGMVHRPLKTAVRRLRERYAPVQVCVPCRADHVRHTSEPVVIMAWFEYWRIECPLCRIPFSPNDGPKLDRCNPVREEPNWFAQILPYARRGAAQLATFVRQPYGSSVSPVSILRLLSMRLTHSAFAAPRSTACSAEDDGGGHHCIAELFVAGLEPLLHREPLLPTLWTERRPVRLVTARTILFAAMAKFLADPRAAYARIVRALDRRSRATVDRWFRGLPEHSARVFARV